jgi:hypothetical protein
VEIIFTLITIFKRLNLLLYGIQTQRHGVICHNNPKCHSLTPGYSQLTAMPGHKTTPKMTYTSDQPQSSKLGKLRVLIPHHVQALGRHRLVVGRQKGFLDVHTCDEINKNSYKSA